MNFENFKLSQSWKTKGIFDTNKNDHHRILTAIETTQVHQLEKLCIIVFYYT